MQISFRTDSPEAIERENLSCLLKEEVTMILTGIILYLSVIHTFSNFSIELG